MTERSVAAGRRRSRTSAASAGVAAILLVTACTSSGDQRSQSTTPDRGQPRPSVSDPTTGGSAADAFADIEGFRFIEVSPRVEQDIAARVMPIFAHTEAVEVAVRSVHTAGGQLPVRLLVVSYSLPPDVPFERLVYDVGREFLGATPANATPTLDSHGVYMRSMTRGRRTESVAFFAGENLFVYVFGGTIEAPTEEIAKKLYEANCEIRTCERPGIY